SPPDRPCLLHGGSDDAGATAKRLDTKDWPVDRRIFLRPTGRGGSVQTGRVLGFAQMRRKETIVESEERVLELDAGAAELLGEIGMRLASKAGWWGDEEDKEGEEPSVIRMRSVGRRRWGVTVRDAVGMVATPGVEMLIEAKIPMTHLLYLGEK